MEPETLDQIIQETIEQFFKEIDPCSLASRIQENIKELQSPADNQGR